MSFVVHTQVEATQEAWESPRRYREFTQLRKRLLRLGIDIPAAAAAVARNGDNGGGGGGGGGLGPELPRKTWRANKFGKEHLETRRAALEAYLQAAVKVGGMRRRGFCEYENDGRVHGCCCCYWCCCADCVCVCVFRQGPESSGRIYLLVRCRAPWESEFFVATLPFLVTHMVAGGDAPHKEERSAICTHGPISFSSTVETDEKCFPRPFIFSLFI